MGTTLPIQAIKIGFNYTQLAPDVRTDVQESARRIHELERRTSESIIEIGHQLIQVRNKLDGEFLPWLAAEFGWSQRTAYNFIQVAERFGVANFANAGQFQPSALYVLAAESTPEEVRIEFTELMKTGRAVRHKDVKEAIAKTKTRTKAEPIPVQEWESEDDDYPEVPYEVVDLSSGEIMPPPGQRHSMADLLPARSTPPPAGALDADDEELEEYDRSPSTPEQCQAVVTALEALLLALQRPEDYGHERVMLTEVIEYLTTHANADAGDQKWMLTELAGVGVDIMRASRARVEALAPLRAKAA